MKNLITKLVIIGFAYFAISCNSRNEGQKDTTQDSVKNEKQNADQQSNNSGFDINAIAVSDNDLGNFPFFSIPDDIEIQNKPLQKKFDRLFFPINGVMQSVEGKVWKASLVGKTGSSDSWSLAYFEKSYDEAIKAVGGVKIFEGKVSQEELDRIKEQATYFGEEGSLDYWNDVVKVYIIRRANEEDIYIQLAGNTSTGKLQILQKDAFKQTITMLKADQIQKDLIQKGKSVLYINFDTDKATLKTDGKEAVNEIAKALNVDKTLKIAINGYTDNIGNETHNLELSKKRAKTVKEELVKIGIDASRLSFEGFGQNSPIADNNSDEGKAQNRRVELIKNQ